MGAVDEGDLAGRSADAGTDCTEAADTQAARKRAEREGGSEQTDTEIPPSLDQLHGLVTQLGRTVQSQWRELQEATRSLDELWEKAFGEFDLKFWAGESWEQIDNTHLTEKYIKEMEQDGQDRQE